MNSLNKATLRFFNIAASARANSLKNIFGKRDLTRSIWHMSKTPEYVGVLNVQKPSLTCGCGCGMKNHIHTKGKLELGNTNW